MAQRKKTIVKSKVTTQKSAGKSKSGERPEAQADYYAGRDTLYTPEYCEQVIAYMKEGNHFGTFGTQIGVGSRVLYTWADKHPAFMQAKLEGEDHFFKFHTDLGKALMTGTLRRIKKEITHPDGRVVKEYESTRGDGRVWGIQMRACFRKHGYAEKLELTGRNGGPILTRDINDMTDEEMEKLDKELANMEKKE